VRWPVRLEVGYISVSDTDIRSRSYRAEAAARTIYKPSLNRSTRALGLHSKIR
jgi:hypothetical protein